MLINQIGQIAVIVKDAERAAKFYQEILELELLFKAGDLSFFNCGGVRLFLSKANEGEENLSTIIYYRVDDIQAVYEKLVNKGVSFIQEPHVIAKVGNKENWMSFFNDSEGNILALFSEVVVS